MLAAGWSLYFHFGVWAQARGMISPLRFSISVTGICQSRKLWEIPMLEHKPGAAHPLFSVVRVRNAMELKQFRDRYISLLL